jgi:hypothetical protein
MRYHRFGGELEIGRALMWGWVRSQNPQGNPFDAAGSIRPREYGEREVAQPFGSFPPSF